MVQSYLALLVAGLPMLGCTLWCLYFPLPFVVGVKVWHAINWERTACQVMLKAKHVTSLLAHTCYRQMQGICCSTMTMITVMQHTRRASKCECLPRGWQVRAGWHQQNYPAATIPWHPCSSSCPNPLHVASSFGKCKQNGYTHCQCPDLIKLHVVPKTEPQHPDVPPCTHCLANTSTSSWCHHNVTMLATGQ
jgi:hypothetical protein